MGWVQACRNRRGLDEDSNRETREFAVKGSGRYRYVEWLLEEDERLRVGSPPPHPTQDGRYFNICLCADGMIQ